MNRRFGVVQADSARYDANMAPRCGKWLFASTVWLTAFTTLFATSPHFECVCPDGSRKPICLSLILGESACCCKEACCQPEPSLDVEPSGGCCHCKPPVKKDAVETKAQIVRGKNPAGVPEIGRASCGRSFAQAVTSIAKRSEQASRDNVVSTWILAAIQSAPLESGLRIEESHRRSTASSLPPPLNLILLHRHFSI